MACIIDADGHIVEPRKLWEEYVEPEFRDRVIRIERSREGLDEFWINGERRRGPGGSIVASVIPGGYLSAERTRAAAWGDILPGSWGSARADQSARRGGYRPRLPLPIFLLDLWRPRGSAARRGGLPRLQQLDGGLLPPLPEAAPRCRADADSGCRRGRDRDAPGGQRAQLQSRLCPPNPYNHRRLNDPAYDIFWREAQELDIPVAVHSSFGTKTPALGADRYLQDGTTGGPALPASSLNGPQAVHKPTYDPPSTVRAPPSLARDSFARARLRRR
jgi:hypothetical protein